MSPLPPKADATIQAQVEHLTRAAKQLSRAGKDAHALDTYGKAAELMPGAPWLQLRTAELARKLGQIGVAAQHYRRAGAAFIGAGFPKRALAPLRTAWALYLAALPQDPSRFVSVTLELAALQRTLVFSAEATLSITSANEALEAVGCSERVPELSELVQSRGEPSLADPGLPPESGVQVNPQTEPLPVVISALKP